MITIRKADAADRAELEACFAALQALERSIEANRAAPEEITREYVDRLLADSVTTRGAIFVAEVDSRTVGFVCVLSRVVSYLIEQERECAYVTDLVVLEPHRSSGIGIRLMQAAEAHALASGAKRVRVGGCDGKAFVARYNESLGRQ